MSEPIAPTTEPSGEPTDAPAAQQAIDWEAEAKKWEKRSKDNFAKLKDAEPKLAEYETWRQERQTVEQRQAEELSRWQTDAERWRNVAVSSRIEAIAAADFADPSDAVTAIGDVTQFLDAGGQIDDAAIREQLAAVLERKPHWRRAEGSAPVLPRIPAPNPAQGVSTPGQGSAAEQFAALVRGQLRT